MPSVMTRRRAADARGIMVEREEEDPDEDNERPHHGFAIVHLPAVAVAAGPRGDRGGLGLWVCSGRKERPVR